KGVRHHTHDIKALPGSRAPPCGVRHPAGARHQPCVTVFPLKVSDSRRVSDTTPTTSRRCWAPEAPPRGVRHPAGARHQLCVTVLPLKVSDSRRVSDTTPTTSRRYRAPERRPAVSGTLREPDTNFA